MTRWSIQHKGIITLLTIVCVVLGGISFMLMERQENPTVVAPIGMVQCIYGGASPEDVEKQIIKPLEDALGEISEIKTIQSYCLDSVGLMKITLKDISDSAITRTWDDIQEKIDDAAVEFPSQASTPTLDTDMASSYGLILGLSSPDYTYNDLKEVATSLENELEQVDGVKKVDLFGEINDQVVIQLDLIKLEQYGVTPTTIGTVLQARNINIPGGNLEIGGTKVPVQVTGEYRSVEEIQNTIVAVSQETGAPIYLKNVADVSRQPENMESCAQVDGQKALLIGVQYAEGLNIIEVRKDLQQVIDQFTTQELYTGMELTSLNDQADFVNESMSFFTSNLVSAIILVVAVVLLFMGIQSAVIVSTPIAIVIAAVFVYMKLTAIPLHQVSLVALIISLSLLVANGIVANDNMYLYLEQGKDRDTACTRGVDEVKIPILTSTLTTVASFIPLLMMQGSGGKFARTLPILVSVALAVSFLVSLTVVPAMGHSFLKLKNPNTKFKQQVRAISEKLHLNQVYQHIMGWYQRCLNRCLHKPVLTILVFVALFAGSLTLLPSMGIQMFPPIERNQYVLDITVQDGSTVQHTMDVVNNISIYLEQDPSVQHFACAIGDGFPKYYVTFESNQQSSNQAEFLISGTRSEAQRVEREIAENFPGVRANVKYLEINMPQDYPVQVRISGDDIDQLRQLSEEAKVLLANVPGAKNIQDNYGYNSNKLSIQVNEEKSNLVGITNYDIASTVRMAINGTEISQLKQDDVDADPIPIVMKLPESAKQDREALGSLFLTSQVTGKNVPLSQIADIRTESSLNKIVRRDGQRTISVGLFLQDGYSAQRVMKDVKAAMADFELPEGYTMEFGGENEFTDETLGSMLIPAIIAIVLIYLILVFQFGHLLEPLIIMGTIPLSCIGVLLGLRMMNYPIGFMALIGAISLMGVVVNNGIVLLDYIKLMLRGDGDLPAAQTLEQEHDAIVAACATRVRPIMIGMITTVISLMPLAASGDTLWSPLAMTINGGMLVSSALTLIVIPCAFLVIYHFDQRIEQRRAQRNAKHDQKQLTAK